MYFDPKTTIFLSDFIYSISKISREPLLFDLVDDCFY